MKEIKDKGRRASKDTLTEVIIANELFYYWSNNLNGDAIAYEDQLS